MIAEFLHIDFWGRRPKEYRMFSRRIQLFTQIRTPKAMRICLSTISTRFNTSDINVHCSPISKLFLKFTSAWPSSEEIQFASQRNSEL
ncbi:MAG: hypothetical protein C4324_04125 [Blastocatellia bacterium]